MAQVIQLNADDALIDINAEHRAVKLVEAPHHLAHGPLFTQERKRKGGSVDLAGDELITAVHVPLMHQGARWGYYKFARKTGEFAEANCAAYFDPESRTARIAVGALDGAPRLLDELAVEVARRGAAAPSG